MRLFQLFATRNDCYKANQRITPKGIMWHSTGANNPNLRRYVGPDDGRLGKNIYKNYWNRPKLAKCCHAFVGKLKDGSVATYQILPWTYRGWHAGSGAKGSANSSHIGFEICEDSKNNKDYALAVYREAIELTAYLCKQFNLDPLGRDVIIDHAEGARLGIASRHGDVLHWFGKYGITLTRIRQDVAAELAKQSASSAAKPKPTDTIADKADLHLIMQGVEFKQVGAFRNRMYAEAELAKRIKAGEAVKIVTVKR